MNFSVLRAKQHFMTTISLHLLLVLMLDFLIVAHNMKIPLVDYTQYFEIETLFWGSSTSCAMSSWSLSLRQSSQTGFSLWGWLGSLEGHSNSLYPRQNQSMTWTQLIILACTGTIAPLRNIKSLHNPLICSYKGLLTTGMQDLDGTR